MLPESAVPQDHQISAGRNAGTLHTHTHTHSHIYIHTHIPAVSEFKGWLPGSAGEAELLGSSGARLARGARGSHGGGGVSGPFLGELRSLWACVWFAANSSPRLGCK